MMLAIKYAREGKVPFLGICLGFQLAVIEWARNVLQIPSKFAVFVLRIPSHRLIFLFLFLFPCFHVHKKKLTSGFSYRG